jgi:nucleotide-binding universal stress UspA family protein
MLWLVVWESIEIFGGVMKRFKNILLVCNFDAKQHMSVERAVSLAKQNEARLTVFSVVKELPADVRMTITSMLPQELLELVIHDRQEKIDALAADMGQQGVDARTQVVTGTPFLEIVRQVLRDKHDLVILAAEGKGGVKERLFGSTSMHLMRKCPCPVWVVKPAKREKYKRILAAVDTASDFPDHERESLNPLIMQLASSLARMDGSEFHLVQVWSVFAEGYLEVRGQMEANSVTKLRKDTKRQYTRKLDSLLAGVDLKGIVVHKHLPRSDNSSRVIVKLAKSKKIDLLVMGTVCRTGLAGFFIGNTAEKVLSEVDCSVLTVKPEGFVTPVTLEEG